MWAKDAKVRKGYGTRCNDLAQSRQLIPTDVGVSRGEVAEAVLVSVIHGCDLRVRQGLDLGIQGWIQHSTELKLACLWCWYSRGCCSAASSCRRKGCRYSGWSCRSSCITSVVRRSSRPNAADSSK